MNPGKLVGWAVEAILLPVATNIIINALKSPSRSESARKARQRINDAHKRKEVING
jgi:hypothetical protein